MQPCITFLGGDRGIIAAAAAQHGPHGDVEKRILSASFNQFSRGAQKLCFYIAGRAAQVEFWTAPEEPLSLSQWAPLNAQAPSATNW